MNVDGPNPFLVFRDTPRKPSSDQANGRADGVHYFQGRAAAERAAAQVALSLEARRRHHELANAYDKLAQEQTSGDEE